MLKCTNCIVDIFIDWVCQNAEFSLRWIKDKLINERMNEYIHELTNKGNDNCVNEKMNKSIDELMNH